MFPMKGNPDYGIRGSFACEIWNVELFFLWNMKSWVLESGIQLKESRIPLTIRIRNASSTDIEPGI